MPGTANIEGRQIPNDESFDLGAVPFHTAFARSCNTTLAGSRSGLPPTHSPTPPQLGLGIDYVTPGLTTVTGACRAPTLPRPGSRPASGRAR